MLLHLPADDALRWLLRGAPATAPSPLAVAARVRCTERAGVGWRGARGTVVGFNGQYWSVTMDSDRQVHFWRPDQLTKLTFAEGAEEQMAGHVQDALRAEEEALFAGAPLDPAPGVRVRIDDDLDNPGREGTIIARASDYDTPPAMGYTGYRHGPGVWLVEWDRPLARPPAPLPAGHGTTARRRFCHESNFTVLAEPPRRVVDRYRCTVTRADGSTQTSEVAGGELAAVERALQQVRGLTYVLEPLEGTP